MQSDFLDLVNNRVVVYDGATGTNIQLRDLGPEDFGGDQFDGCNEILVATRPDVIEDLHRSFFDVGSDVVETDTFGSFSLVLAEYDIADRAYELSRSGAEIAREVADSYSDQKFVAGSIGPGTKLPSLGHIRYADLVASYHEMARALLDGGVDLFIIETCMDLLQIKAAMNACRAAMVDAGREVPIQVQVTIETTGRMLVGSEIGAALVALEPMRPDILGLNCATGPGEMTEHIRHLSRNSPFPISVLPNAGLPRVEGSQTVYDLTPPELCTWQSRFITEFGVSVVGGCCGTTPEHLRQLVEQVRGLTPAVREPDLAPSLTSIYSPVAIRQDTSFLIIGERTNANGSRKFRDAMLEGDWDLCEAMARDQQKEGAHVLDVCVDYVGRDGAIDMDELAGRFATAASVPLVLDSTEPEVLEAGLQHIGGKATLNSANLEEGEAEGKRFDRVLRLAKQYGSAVICLLIDEEGQARDLEWKMRVAHRIHDLATERYGIPASDLIFDALTFPLTTGDDDLRRDAMATIEAITRIKEELPGVHTTLGVSNVSFGLKPAARHVINSVFLAECVKAGLDSAIVHAGKIMPLSKIDDRQREVALDLIYDRRSDGYDPLTEMLGLFEDFEADAAEPEDRTDWPVGERLKHRIIDGDRDGLTDDLDEALGDQPALDIINTHLLDGMKVVGDLFGSGEMQLPFVLQSAETMKASVAHLEPHMEKADSAAKGKVVIATVQGDVHDIGKNLVDIILTNNGYEVYNLGIKIPINDMVAKVKEVGADALGMSGLLVKSTLIMRDNLKELNELGLSDTPVLLGGAALTRSYVEDDLRDVYEGRLFYGKDAFEGLRTMDKLMDIRTGRVDDDPDFGIVKTGRKLPKREKVVVDPADLPDRSPEAELDNPVFEPPFLGSKVVKGIALDEIAEYINETALFRNQWQFRPEKRDDGTKETDDDFKTRVRSVLREQLANAKANDLLVPQVVYGYFPANQDGNDVVIWTDDDRTTERTRFSYPRQSESPFLNIADFFRPVAANSADSERDYAAFHIVTMGSPVSEEAARLFAADKYTEYLFLHGLGVEMAEALAEYWHHRIREEWGFADEDGPSLQGLFRQKYRGGRYSWGYPACPDLEDNMRVAELLGADRIGVKCSEETSFQYQPEQTTSAIICHHPRAKYFVAR